MGRKEYYVYLMASPSGTLYIGVTGNLEHRVQEHQQGLVEGFTKKYGCFRLVYYELFQYVLSAIAREKQLKNWNRTKKENLIHSFNPDWRDLSEEWKT
jgi:putative endonuclease